MYGASSARNAIGGDNIGVGAGQIKNGHRHERTGREAKPIRALPRGRTRYTAPQQCERAGRAAITLIGRPSSPLAGYKSPTSGGAAVSQHYVAGPLHRSPHARTLARGTVRNRVRR